MPAADSTSLHRAFHHLKPMKKMKRSGLQERSEGTINGVTISPGPRAIDVAGQIAGIPFPFVRNMESPDVGVLIMEKKLGHPAW
jgi:hypothetical protein